MAIVMELIGVSVRPIVGKALSAKFLVTDHFLDDELRSRMEEENEQAEMVSPRFRTWYQQSFVVRVRVLYTHHSRCRKGIVS
jgi:hypothetical protein